MEIAALCAVAVCLRLFPSRSQFFRYESVTLSCEGKSTEWRVWRNTSKQINRLCPSYLTHTNESKCNLTELYEFDSGVYWCESAAGERSGSVNISITDEPLILQSPGHPVNEGEALMLHCRFRPPLSSNLTAFYRNGVLVGNSSTGTFAIQSVSKSDEGFYRCNASGVGESAEIWLDVRGRRPQTPTAPIAFVLLPVVAGLLLLIALILLCHWRNHKGGVNRSVSYTEVTISQDRKPQRITGSVPTVYSTVIPESC
ncbi:high affinity immunoglobulin gamma Fc receptor I-like isoform X2 [Poeciliopsis prolifica]|uniref:high affinity immunoglobulin gamma Fc receptor I-like isoform X2 n=1 Tax=Poeciliopsis prolifica TaxID=188132 RepID=UPI002413D4D1|nr:high affinity immunoglobulin gamma Fc receptor I-like isoform X2 [Poeciliopsis prolifica]